MVRPKLPALALGLSLGLLGAGLVVGFALWLNRGSQTRLEGTILKVRTVSTDTSSSIAVIDLRVKNPARALFLVREVTVEAATGAGKVVQGVTVSEPDLDRVLAYYPATGPRFNPVLKARDRLREGETVDRTIAASFPLSEGDLAARRSLAVKILDADGALVEIRAGSGR